MNHSIPEIKDIYKLDFGIYNFNRDRTPLEPFNIKVKVLDFTDEGRQVIGMNKEFQDKIGIEGTVKYKKAGTFVCDVNGQEMMFMELAYKLHFSTDKEENLDIKRFLKGLELSDITKEFKKVLTTLTFGYLHLNNDESQWAPALRKWVEKNPDSMVLLSDNRGTKKCYGNEFFYFPSPSHQMEEFKSFMTEELKNHPKYLKVLDAYCEDWSKAVELEQKRTMKIKVN